MYIKSGGLWLCGVMTEGNPAFKGDINNDLIIVGWADVYAQNNTKLDNGTISLLPKSRQ